MFRVTELSLGHPRERLRYDWHTKIVRGHSHMAMCVAIERGPGEGHALSRPEPGNLRFNARRGRKGLGKLEWARWSGQWLNETRPSGRARRRSRAAGAEPVQRDRVFFSPPPRSPSTRELHQHPRMLQFLPSIKCRSGRRLGPIADPSGSLRLKKLYADSERRVTSGSGSTNWRLRS